MLKRVFTFSLLLVIVVVFSQFIVKKIGILSNSNAVNNVNKMPITTLTPNRQEVSTSEQTGDEPQYSAWIPWWDEERALVSLNKAKSKLGIISPVWYKLDKQSKIIKIQSANKQGIKDAATSAQLTIIPVIGNDFDSERTSIFLWNETLRKNETDRLVNIALLEGYSGWDLDWEEISENDKDKFSDFVNYFAQRLHADNLKLIVTVHAQTGQPTDWEGSSGQDWSELFRNADFIRIMAYDFHNTETVPGPITPPDKLREVINYAVSVIPKEKIVLGLPTYGYDWSRKDNRSYQYVDILELIEEFNGFYEYDSKSMAIKGNYIANEVEHTLWFENSKSIAQKISLARSFGIYQFSFWSLGGEDQRIWD